MDGHPRFVAVQPGSHGGGRLVFVVGRRLCLTMPVFRERLGGHALRVFRNCQ